MKEILQQNGLLLTGTCDLNDFTFEIPFLVWGGVRAHQVSVGAYGYISPNTSITNASMGRHSCVGHQVSIGLSHHWPNDVMMVHLTPFAGISTRGLNQAACLGYDIGDISPSHTSIGNDVWIGAHALIPAAHDITIGNGAIVAAGSVVSKDVPAFAVVAGSPARVVKMRFSDEICADLEASSWWDYDWQEAAAALPGLARIAPLNDAKAFCAWWRDDGADMMKPYLIIPQKRRVRREGQEVFLDKLL